MPGTATSWTLREAETADFPAIQALYAHYVGASTATFEEISPTVEEMRRRFAAVRAAGLPWLVAAREGRVLGYAYAHPFHARSAYRFTVEDSVYLDPAACGQGIGTALLGAVIAAGTESGARQMVALIGDRANLASIALHKSLRFREAGVLEAVGFKFGRFLDVVVMQRSLGEGAETTPPGPETSRLA